MNRLEIALLALLHAIARFYLASIKQASLESALRETANRCAFVAPFLPDNWEDILKDILEGGQHPISQRIREAERLASGGQIVWKKEQSSLLRAVLSTICDGSPEPAYFLPGRLGLDDDSLFPRVQHDKQQSNQAAKQLWEDFAKALSELSLSPPGTQQGAVNALYALLAYYASTSPAPTPDGAGDVALFDLVRVTAAIACARDGDNPNAALLSGDISGIQNFIYTITARGATPALRGRSFYLQILTEAIARFILRQLELPIINLIYASGGHFYLIVPAAASAALPGLAEKLDSIMLNAHDGKLYVALGMTVLNEKDFVEDFSSAWGRVGEAVSAAKRRRFAMLGAALFDVPERGGSADATCQVCHHEGEDVESDVSVDPPVRKCALCRSLEQIGRDLRGARHIALSEIEYHSSADNRAAGSVLGQLGTHLMIDRDRDIEGWTDPPRNARSALLLGLRNFPTPEARSRLLRLLSCEVVSGLRFSVNVTPLTPRGERATFEDLEDAANGLKRIGALRMDVDNLGAVFSRGLRGSDGKSRGTLARTATLSAALNRYFEGWVGELCRRINDEAIEKGETQPLYTIYSGGDDLFIVGAWDRLPALAEQIRDDFSRFCGGNPSLHLSGGLALFGGKQPLYQAADHAAEALEAAKALPGKNAFTMFGVCQTWEQFETVTEKVEEMVSIVNEANNRSLVQTLLDMYAQYLDARREKGFSAHDQRVVWGAYMWRGAYQLKRLSDRQKQPVQNKINRLIGALAHNHYAAIEQVGLAARWAEGLTRKERRGDK